MAYRAVKQRHASGSRRRFFSSRWSLKKITPIAPKRRHPPVRFVQFMRTPEQNRAQQQVAESYAAYYLAAENDPKARRRFKRAVLGHTPRGTTKKGSTVYREKFPSRGGVRRTDTYEIFGAKWLWPHKRAANRKRAGGKFKLRWF